MPNVTQESNYILLHKLVADHMLKIPVSKVPDILISVRLTNIFSLSRITNVYNAHMLNSINLSNL